MYYRKVRLLVLSQIVSFNCQFSAKMEVLSKSCVCQSTNKKLRIVAHENFTEGSFLCKNDEFAINLEIQDYEALGFCKPPVMDQYYSIGLRLPDINTNNRGICNSSSHPYFWWTRRNEEIDCVDGSPLKLPRNFDGDRYCNLASVLPGSLDQIYNANWTRCTSVQYSICQLERNASITNFCKNASTPTATTTATSTTTPTATTTVTTAIKATATITALSNNSTAIIIGSVLGVLVILFLVLLLHLIQKRNKANRNASKKRNHKVAVQK